MQAQESTESPEQAVCSHTAPVPIYLVHYVEDHPNSSTWDKLPNVQLTDVVSGEVPALLTHVRMCWSDYALHLQFRCEDDIIVSPFTKRDDSLFDADVVEWFIAPSPDEQRYYEFNISPHNVIFDSMITHEKDQPLGFHPEWNAEGIMTQVRYTEPDKQSQRGSVQIEYTAVLPFADLNASPQPGEEWRINMFRIDQDAEGTRSFSAWSPTGAIQFHVPERFGRIRFFKS
ncbi:carbohydrate-binding family 9-like protein [Paenibacillus marinisediminis]